MAESHAIARHRSIGQLRAVENFVSVVDNKPVNKLTVDDAITEWWRDRS
jgi:hypothetical protein